jgi:16S rRNA (adenine1518-N6/adenine1519-N6)-dimethyltransferase
MDTEGSTGAVRDPASLIHDLPSPSEMEKLTPRALLKRLGLSARKSFSQNFLTDRYVVAEIVEAAGLSQSDTVLEVGPGLGIMTRTLARVAGRVVAVELDRKLAELLPRLVDHPEKLEVVQSDILQFDPGSALPPGYVVVANLPYHITSPALRHLLTGPAKPRRMVVMVQKEVAERIAARPGDMSLLSVMAQIYGEVKLVTKVPAEAFFPAPKVDSAVLRIDVYERPPLNVDAPEDFLRVVAAGFSRRRKQLHNSLSESLWFPTGGEYQVLEAARIDPARRAQTLTLEEWARLYAAYNQARAGWREG